ncbi:MAG: hypothetical protein GF368_02170 [Candidatus Aenigmarchaeota archaeon]|nr:hypothetical protein [Candidatus Aenigmarchaeota archaeon]
MEKSLCIVCKEPANNLVLYCEKTGIKVVFCRKHIEDCLTCGRCEIQEIN